MLGAIIGDIVGSRFEFNNHKSKVFELFHKQCDITDDSIMTIAIAKAIMESNNNLSLLEKNAIYYMQYFGRKYPYPKGGYGGRFGLWLQEKSPKPYNSYGNGSAMRVSACGFMGKSLKEVKDLSNTVTKVTHNHSEGLKGAEATAVAIYLAKAGKSKQEIKEYIEGNYYKLDFTLDEIRDNYLFNESCQGTIPQALECFFESENFEDAIRNAISIGGDSDTIGAITGAVAEAYYGITEDLRNSAYNYLDKDLKKVVEEFYRKIFC